MCQFYDYFVPDWENFNPRFLKKQVPPPGNWLFSLAWKWKTKRAPERKRKKKKKDFFGNEFTRDPCGRGKQKLTTFFCRAILLSFPYSLFWGRRNGGGLLKMKEEKLKRIRCVAVYCSSRMPVSSVYVEATADFGRYLAEHGMSLVYGGSNIGLMKVLADTVLENGGTVYGVFPAAFPESLRHLRLSGCSVVETLAERKAEMLRRADVAVALPGAFGTWDELFDALALRKTKQGHCRSVGVLNVNGYFDPLLEWIERSIQEGFASPKCRHLLKSGKTPELLFKQLAGPG